MKSRPQAELPPISVLRLNRKGRDMDAGPLFTSLRLAVFTTILLFPLSLPVALWLSRSRGITRVLGESLIALPLVLPPTVIGFYLLFAFSPYAALGGFLERTFGIRLAFTFSGILAASCISSLPFMVQPLKNGFQSVPYALCEASYTLGRGPIETFFRVILPNAGKAALSGCAMTFAHGMGEFGVILMVGGAIPGSTRTASVAIYQNVERLDFSSAHIYSAVLVSLSLSVLFGLQLLNGNAERL